MPLPNLDKYEKYEQLTQGKVRYLEAGSGKDVLLLHGMGVYTSASTFQFMFEPLAAKYHVVALDYLGFGNSDRVLGNGPTFDVIVDGIREFMDKKGIAHASVVGHSAGPWFGGILAYESPDRVDNLIGIGTAGMNVTPVASVSGYQPPSVESAKAANMNSVYEGSKFTEALAQEMAEQMITYAERPGAVDGLRPLVAQMANPDTRKSYLLQRRMPHLKMPVLFIWGESEGMEPSPTWTEEWESTGHNPGKSSKPWVAPNSKFELVPGATHNVHWEQPDLMVKLVTDFIG